MRIVRAPLALLLLAAFSPQLHAKTSLFCASSSTTERSVEAPRKLIVLGFMGGRVHATNYVHLEASMAQELQRRYPDSLHTEVFANHDASNALATLLSLLDADRDGCLSPAEKSSARIVLYGHSWGASETVTLARRLQGMNIPVLLTVQVDSVQKPAEDDGVIPPNVHEAINFYQTEGLLHGRATIHAMDPKRTTILGNFQSTYRATPVALTGYPWFARTFMKQHIEIENDRQVWDRIEALIGAKASQQLAASN
jgi:hypothetical protein